MRSFDHGVDEESNRCDRQNESGEVDAMWIRILGSGEIDRAEDESNRRDREVHEEHRAPVVMLEQEPACDWTKCDSHAGHRRPDSDRLRPFDRVAEHVDEDCKRCWEHRCRTNTHRSTRDDQLTGRVGE